MDLAAFKEIWLVDFEYKSDVGEKPIPHCVVAKEIKSNKTIRAWCDKGMNCLYRTDTEVLFVSYNASAEMSCHLVLGWPIPANILDLYVEHKRILSGLIPMDQVKLLMTLEYYGIEHIESEKKEFYRNLAIKGGPFSKEQKQGMLNYCETDVIALSQLLPVMMPEIELDYALIRGEYMAGVARMENNGTPIDTDLLTRLRKHWLEIENELIKRVDADYGVFNGRTFKKDKWEEWLTERDYAWPRTASGQLCIDKDTFKEMAAIYPDVADMRELLTTLGLLRLNELSVGKDGRNRCYLNPFGAKTGRNQPSSKRFIFGPSTWVRSLIKPAEDMAVAYIDYEQQEFGIGAALSNDIKMKEAYLSGDPYLALAKQAGAVPIDATKKTHGAIRDMFKVVVLMTQYGAGVRSMAINMHQSEIKARRLLEHHKTIYRKFWRWMQEQLDTSLFTKQAETLFKWQVNACSTADKDGKTIECNSRSIMNFPMQGNGAEILRLAICMLFAEGIKVVAPVHDAILIEAKASEIDEIVKKASAIMVKASSILLDGFELRTEPVIVKYPERYIDKRGVKTWQNVMEILAETESKHV